MKKIQVQLLRSKLLQNNLQNRTYHLHIVLEDDMKQTLKDAAELAFKMGDIPKADLVNIMELFITWGLAVMKQKWLERVGYK
jgi:hypothetical protein